MRYYRSLLFWLLLLIAAVYFLNAIRSILLPFVVALIAAYFLNPAATRLERAGVSRGVSTALIIIVFFVAVVGGLVLLLPVLSQQGLALLDALPGYVQNISDQFLPELYRRLEHVAPGASQKLHESLGDMSGKIMGLLSQFALEAWNSGVAMLNILALLLLTPIVTFYVLADWNRMLSKINSWLPPAHAPVIREQCRAIDRTLAGYIRGQTNVCLILAAFYGVGLSLTGLHFGLFVGILTGFLSFVPFIGVLTGFSVALVLSLMQFSDPLPLMMVLGVFGAGQILEGNFLTPNLVGSRVNVHPVWLIFGMLTGAAVFGLVGVLIAVPATAVIGVLIRFSLGQYLKSEMYLK